MKNYFEKLAFADRLDLEVEHTKAYDSEGFFNCTSYLGFKNGENSKTLFVLPNDFKEVKEFLYEFKESKYRNTNLYKKMADMILNYEVEADRRLANEVCNSEMKDYCNKLETYINEFGAELDDYSKEYLDDFYTMGNIDIIVPNDEIFVLGDNRSNSRDSRDSSIGTIEISDIIGKVAIRILPINKVTVFD